MTKRFGVKTSSVKQVRVMSKWHYQLMKHNEYYAVHEFYPSDNGGSWTKKPVDISGDSVQDIKESIQMILNDIDKHGVKDYE